MVLLALHLAQAQAQPPAARPQPPLSGVAPAEGPAGWRERFDQLWKVRDQPGAEKEMEQALVQPLAADPRSFEANWRLASLYNWEANAKEGGEKAALGKKAWEAGDKAILA